MTLPYSLTRTSEPAAEPVSLTDLKAALNVDHSNDDDELTRLIEFGRQAVERDTGLSLITQTWRLKLDAWPCKAIVLHNPPVQSVTSITYVDTNGDTQTWDSGNYVVDTDSQPGLVTLAYSKSWPTLRGDNRGITVTYVTGFGDASTDVPYELVQAVMQRVRMEYDGWCDAVGQAYERIVRARQVGVYP